MSRKELKRVEVLSRVKRGELKVTEAAELLEVSYRQAKRLKKRRQEGGSQALVHGKVGRVSNRADDQRRERVLALVRGNYSGEPHERFGPTLASEHLASDHHIEVPRETLRRWMLAAGLWSRQRKRKAHRKRRQRKAHFGEGVQVDGSHHPWLEGRGPKACLMNFVDDATGVALGRFSSEETTWAAADLLAAWVRRYGVPQALYCDWKNVCKRQPASREAIEAVEPETQFGRICAKLGIRIIAASSPQAKGRVERHHSTHQDRMIKKMRLEGIGDYEAANRYIEERYLPEHNAKFGCEPAAEADFHQRLPKGLDLEWVFCLEAERRVSNDLVVRFENRFLQLKPKRNPSLGAGSRVKLEQGRDGELRVRFEGRAVAFDEIDRPQPKGRGEPRQRGARQARKPAVDHPWRRPLLPRKRKTAKS